MPIFEYKCNDCGKKFDILHKSTSNHEEVVCPNCQSKNSKKLLSTFSASFASSSSYNSAPSCSDGSCGTSYGGGCANGMCGLN